MSDDYQSNDVPHQETLHVTVNLKLLRMRDLAKLEKNSENGDWNSVIPIMARVTGLTEEQVWDFDFETMMTVQTTINAAMNEVLKKTNVGN